MKTNNSKSEKTFLNILCNIATPFILWFLVMWMHTHKDCPRIPFRRKPLFGPRVDKNEFLNDLSKHFSYHHHTFTMRRKIRRLRIWESVKNYLYIERHIGNWYHHNIFSSTLSRVMCAVSISDLNARGHALNPETRRGFYCLKHLLVTKYKYHYMKILNFVLMTWTNQKYFREHFEQGLTNLFTSSNDLNILDYWWIDISWQK